MANYFGYADDNRGRAAFTSGNTGSEAENSPIANVVYVAHAEVRHHPHKQLFYRLDANVADNNYFTINATTGAVTFNASPDYEGQHGNTYSIVITAYDGRPRHTVQHAVTITVTDVNDNAPVFTSGTSATTPENVSTTTAVYTAHATDADGTSPNNTVHYSLAANTGDNNLFNIDANTGAVTFKTSPDFEHPTDAGGNNVYDVTVTATDGGTPAKSTAQTVHITVTDVNETPTITSAASASEAENTPASTIVYTAHATDPDTTAPNNTLKYSLSGADAAAFNINQTTGDVRFNTSPDYEAPTDQNHVNAYHITVTATDGGTPALSSSKDVTINVTNVNEPPTAANDSLATYENQALTIKPSDLLGNDTDPEHDTLTVTNVSAPQHGKVTPDGQGNYIYTPNANYYGTDSFTYQASDGQNVSNTATVSINVAQVNEPPSGADKTVTTNEDMSYTFAASDFGFSDTDGNTLAAVKIASLPAAGSLTDNGMAVTANQAISVADINNGLLKFTPAADANGNAYATFTFQVQDNGGTAGGGQDTDPSPNTITVNVNPVNDAPSFTLPSTTTTSNEDAGAQTVAGFATNISPGPANESGQTVSFIVDSNSNPNLFAAGGSPAIDANGNLTYTAAANANGSATITVHAMDNGGTANGGVDHSAGQTFTINVNPVNDAPSFTLPSTTTTSNEDAGAQTVAGFATNISPGPANESSQTVSFVVDSNSNPNLFAAGGGPAIDANGNLTYTAAANANGSATITVHAMDNGGTANGGVDHSAGQTFTINVNPVNDPPSFTLPSTTTTSNEDAGAQTVAGFATNISPGPANESGQTVSFVVDSNSNPNLFAAGGGPAIDANGNLTYTAAANANGSATITVHAMDNGGTANGGVDHSAGQTFTINVNPVNDAPSFTLPSTTTTSNEDAGAQTVAGFATNISPGPANESSQTVSFVVDSDSNPNLFAAGGGPAIDANGNLTYTAAANANGSATITVHAMDNGGTANGGVDHSAGQTFTINVNPVNDAPSFTLPSTTTTSNEDAGAQTVASFATNISPGPANESSQTVSFVVDSDSNPNLFAAGGGPAIDANGNLTYTAAANANGSATITVHAMDNGGTANGGVDHSAGQTFTINVNPVNDAPQGTDETISGPGSHTFTVGDFGFSDPNDTPPNALKAVEITTLPGSGSLTDNGNAVHAGDFIPVADINGGKLVFTAASTPAPTSFTFQVQDDGGTANGGQDTDQSPNTITLVPDQPPMITSGGGGDTATYSVPENSTNVTTVTATDPDNGPQPISYSIVGGADQAKFTIDQMSGALSFKTAPDYENPLGSTNGGEGYVVQVSASDGVLSDTQTITVNVTNVNEPPTTNAAMVNSFEDTATSITLTGSDPDASSGDHVASYTITNLPSASQGTLFTDSAHTTPVVSGQAYTGPTLTLYFQPAANFNGSVTFNATATDSNNLAGNTATQTINVAAVNDAPTTSNHTINPSNDATLLEDHTYTFKTADFPFSDTADNPNPNTLLNVIVTSLPGAGTLMLNGAAVTLDPTSHTATVSATDIAAGHLTFVPAADGNGSPYASFGFEVQDNGGTANGGQDTSTAATETINVTPVNDPPTFTVPTRTQSNEDAGAQTVTNFVTAISPGPSNESTQTVSLSVIGDTNASLFSVAPSISNTGTLTYTAAANASGTATITVQAMDNGGTANGGSNTTSHTFAIDVAPVAETPTLAVGTYQATAVSGSSHMTTAAGGHSLVYSTVSADSGGYVIAYTDSIGDPSNPTSGEIDFQRYNDSGTAIGSLVRVTTGNDTSSYVGGLGNYDEYGNVAKLSSGGFIVDWTRSPSSYGSGDLTQSIFGRIYDANGNPVGNEFVIGDGEAQNRYMQYSSAAGLSDGSSVVVYQSQDTSQNGLTTSIYGQHVSANGTLLGSPVGIVVSTTPTGNPASGHVYSNESVTALPGGGFLVAWQDESVPGNGTSQNNIEVQRYDASFNKVGGLITVNQTANTAQDPFIATLANGGWVVAYESVVPDPNNSQVNDFVLHARVYSATGVAGSEITVATGTTLTDSNIAALPDGGFVASWTNGSSGQLEIDAQRYDASGAPVGTQFQVEPPATNLSQGSTGQAPAVLATLNNGSVVSTSTTGNASNPDETVQSIVFSNPGDGVQSVPTTLTTLTATDSDPSETISYILSGFSSGTTFSVNGHTTGALDTNAASPTYGDWIITSSADITALKTSALTATVPTAGTFTLTIDARSTDTATLSTGTATSTADTTKTIQVAIHTTADPVFAAHDAGPFALHLSAVADTATVHVDALPTDGQLAYADGTTVKAGAVLSASQLAGLKFTPLDDGADHASNFIYTISNGPSVETDTLPIYVQHGSNLTLTGTPDKDVIVGGAGNDVINGAGGGNWLTGGGGANTFVFDAKALSDASSAALVDHVTDYSAAQHDTLDFTALFAATSQPAAHASELVHATEDAGGGSATVSVNVAAAGAAPHWVDIAHLDGVQQGATVDVALDAAHPQHILHIHVGGLA